MSRFGNLEFDGELESFVPGHGNAVKDEAFYAREALAAFQRADFEAALRHYSKVLEHNPNNTSGWSGQVRMLIELEEYREARLWAEKALERFPHDPELLAAKAVALARSGDAEAAITFSDASIEERGDTPYVWLARGDVLLARNEKRADFCFEKALLISSGDSFVRWLAGRIYYFYEQFSLALKLLRQAVEQNTDSFMIWFDLGRCQEALGLLAPAALSFQQAVQLNPRCSDARNHITRLSNAGFGSRITAVLKRLFHR
jgi:tetratricopeptide (TPR) repeat protein